jgi:hypothetical protein
MSLLFRFSFYSEQQILLFPSHHSSHMCLLGEKDFKTKGGWTGRKNERFLLGCVPGVPMVVCHRRTGE